MVWLRLILSLLLAGSVYYFAQFGFGSIPAVGKLLNPVSGLWAGQADESSKFASEIESDQLKGPVEIVYDQRLIPHIFAKNEHDLFFAQGYVTASNRLWQMEFQTHAAAGRLTEILGAGAGNRILNYDQRQRRYGMLLAAERSDELAKKYPDYYKVLQAYANGVNAYIETLSSRELPAEYKLIGYKPEKWTPLKTALLMKMMTKTLAFSDDDLESSNTLDWMGKELFDKIYKVRHPKAKPMMDERADWGFKSNLSFDDGKNLPAGFKGEGLPKQNRALGSNNWAVSGKKTKNGHAILANDPHLGLGLPSIWYEIHLNCPGINAYGVSLPGSPAVILGFNDNMAWGSTNMGRDVKDWYKITWQDDSHQAYLFDGSYRKVEHRVEAFTLKNGDVVYDTIPMTVHGPVHSTNNTKSAYNNMALKWLAHEPSNDGLTFYLFNKAKNTAQYKEALKHFDTPAQNLIFATTAGDIGITSQGKFPIRPGEFGRFALDGSTSSTLWSGYIPKDQNPQEINPQRGFVFSANQEPTELDYPYDYYGYFSVYRARILHEQLVKMDGITVDDMKALQQNSFSYKTADAAETLIALLDENELSKDEKEALSALKGWDHNHTWDNKVAPLIHEWSTKFYEAVWDEIQAERKETKKPLLWPESWHTYELAKADPTNVFFDDLSTDEKEDARAISLRTFKEAFVVFEANDEPWFEYRNTTLTHLAEIPGMSRSDIQSNGEKNALNAMGDDWGPSWRLVAEMSTPIKAWGVYPGGQSGDSGSEHYDDFIEPWAKGKYFELHNWKKPPALNNASIKFTQKMNPKQ